MKWTVAVVALVVAGLVGGAAVAQEKANPLPLSGFVKKFTDIRATSAQKEVGLPEGTWYEGTITVSDVDYYKPQGQDPPWIEIKDWNYPGGCYMLLFRTNDVDGGLKLSIGDQAVIRAKLSEIGVHLGKFVSNCETHVGLFREAEILTIHKPTN
ncbi:MAG TPA: hypothetical protein VI078_07500 [bacterium]